jgi:hypothetical protein
MEMQSIYTKDGTVITPNGREFANLNFALKAYGLTEEEFNNRLQTGYSIREAFVGKDYDCGLKFADDGYIHDTYGHQFKDLESLCAYHNADIVWFKRLYTATHDMRISLKQESNHKTFEFIDSCNLHNREKEKEKSAAVEAKRVADENLLHRRKQVVRARQVLEKYASIYVESYKGLTLHRANQIVDLCDFITVSGSLTYTENRLLSKAQTALHWKTYLTSKGDDPNQHLVDSILEGFDRPRLAKKSLKSKTATTIASKITSTKSSLFTNSSSTGLVKSAEKEEVQAGLQTAKEKSSNSTPISCYESGKVVKKPESEKAVYISEAERAKKEDIRKKRAEAGRISAEKRKAKKLLDESAVKESAFAPISVSVANENSMANMSKDVAESRKKASSMTYSEIEEETIRILQAYLGDLNSF